MEERDGWNGARFRAGDGGGHYESWFQRANHRDRPLGFWIRYTIFSPRGRPEDAEGELWAIWFDGERQRIDAVKENVPIARCRFSKSDLDVGIGEAALDGSGLRGAASALGRRIEWSLSYTSPEPPLLFLPREFYPRPFPKAKALCGSPGAVFRGSVTVDGEAHDVDGWVGSQNHNWGSKHTDRYAWGQVAGFDGAPGSFLECITGKIRLGPVYSPSITLVVVRLDGEELRLNTLRHVARARGRYEPFRWSFEARDDRAEVRGTITAPRAAFVGLPYRNPPGGVKTCLNSKIARCELSVRHRGGPARSLVSAHRAAFEILTDDRDHGVPVLAV
jgi:hypothetical protein